MKISTILYSVKRDRRLPRQDRRPYSKDRLELSRPLAVPGARRHTQTLVCNDLDAVESLFEGSVPDLTARSVWTIRWRGPTTLEG
ncbi:MAG: hypothetical protein ACREJ6_07850 [Candidatus Methylomirabilis sp.]